MILKSYIVEKNPHVLEEYQASLFYGENDGIKEDIRTQLKKHNKSAEIINLFELEILKNRNILFENIFNVSLFNEKKIIFIHMATEKILNEILECLEKNNKDVKVYIFSDLLDKKSKLRNLFEKNKNLAILACYADNDRTLIDYISRKLYGYKGVTGELINLIITNSGSNRKIIQNEIIKIKDFFIDKSINRNHLLEILNIKNNTSFEEIRDSALAGKKDKINKLLSEIDILNEDCFFYLNIINYRILKLIEIQKKKEDFNTYEKTLENLKPPIFWKDKPLYLEQLKKWNLNKLNKIANRVGETEILMKKNTQIRNDVVIKELIVSLSKDASTIF